MTPNVKALELAETIYSTMVVGWGADSEMAKDAKLILEALNRLYEENKTLRSRLNGNMVFDNKAHKMGQS